MVDGNIFFLLSWWSSSGVNHVRWEFDHRVSFKWGKWRSPSEEEERCEGTLQRWMGRSQKERKSRGAGAGVVSSLLGQGVARSVGDHQHLINRCLTVLLSKPVGVTTFRINEWLLCFKAYQIPNTIDKLKLELTSEESSLFLIWAERLVIAEVSTGLSQQWM